MFNFSVDTGSNCDASELETTSSSTDTASAGSTAHLTSTFEIDHGVFELTAFGRAGTSATSNGVPIAPEVPIYVGDPAFANSNVSFAFLISKTDFNPVHYQFVGSVDGGGNTRQVGLGIAGDIFYGDKSIVNTSTGVVGSRPSEVFYRSGVFNFSGSFGVYGQVTSDAQAHISFETEIFAISHAHESTFNFFLRMTPIPTSPQQSLGAPWQTSGYTTFLGSEAFVGSPLGGVDASGEARLSSGSVAEVAALIIGSGSSGRAIIEGEGTVLEAEHFISVGTNPDQLIAGSQLVVRDGALLKSPLIFVGANGTLSGSNATLDGVVEVHGTLSPGESPGLMNIAGNLDLASDGLLLIEIAGSVAGVEYDVLNVSGDANLSGTLEIKLLDGFIPDESLTFDFLNALNLIGNFDHLIFPIFNGKSFLLTFGTNGVTASVAPVPLPAAFWLLASAIGGLGLIRRKAA